MTRSALDRDPARFNDGSPEGQQRGCCCHLTPSSLPDVRRVLANPFLQVRVHYVSPDYLQSVAIHTVCEAAVGDGLLPFVRSCIRAPLLIIPESECLVLPRFDALLPTEKRQWASIVAHELARIPAMAGSDHCSSDRRYHRCTRNLGRYAWLGPCSPEAPCRASLGRARAAAGRTLAATGHRHQTDRPRRDRHGPLAPRTAD